MPDAIFEEPRLAALYDPLHLDRRDLHAYLALAEELGAHSVLDIGCGTGTFACLLAERRLEVTAVDPAIASIAIARGKPYADRVRWLVGEASLLPPLQVDLVTMTGNVAQVFLTDEEWTSTLRSVSDSLHRDGHLVFEVRDPARQGWKRWTREHSLRRHDLPETGGIETWVELVDVTPPLVSFRWTFVFEADGAVLTSDSTLRFRDRAEIDESLDAAGFVVDEVRDAPDRPGDEFVFMAQRNGRLTGSGT
jgi:SAM-dependent methyltransferase